MEVQDLEDVSLIACKSRLILAMYPADGACQ